MDPLPGDERFEGRLCIPYLTPTGVVNMNFRCMEDHECKEQGDHKKYLRPTGAIDKVYNVQALHEAGPRIFLAEGEFDALCATVVGFPCLGVSGANKWQAWYPKLFEDFDETVILADGDQAGRDHAKFVRGELDNSRIVYMPAGDDVNSFLHKHPIADFRELVR